MTKQQLGHEGHSVICGETCHKSRRKFSLSLSLSPTRKCTIPCPDRRLFSNLTLPATTAQTNSRGVVVRASRSNSGHLPPIPFHTKTRRSSLVVVTLDNGRRQCTANYGCSSQNISLPAPPPSPWFGFPSTGVIAIQHLLGIVRIV